MTTAERCGRRHPISQWSTTWSPRECAAVSHSISVCATARRPEKIIRSSDGDRARIARSELVEARTDKLALDDRHAARRASMPAVVRGR